MRLIDADALKSALEIAQYNDYDDLLRTERIIDNAPTVELKNPDWETINTINKRTRKKETYVFCPCCGASYLRKEGAPE